jgi:hypothetical protein
MAEPYNVGGKFIDPKFASNDGSRLGTVKAKPTLTFEQKCRLRLDDKRPINVDDDDDYVQQEPVKRLKNSERLLSGTSSVAHKVYFA